MDGFLVTLDRADRTLSRPFHFLCLPPLLERVIGFGKGELVFDPKSIAKMLLPGLAIGEFVFSVQRLFTAGSSVLALAVGTTIALKLFAFERERPDPVALQTPARSVDVRTHASLAGNKDSFPSGCALVGTTMGYFAYLFTGHSTFLMLIPLSCFVRVYSCCHWLGDTLGGAVLGFAVVSFAYKVTNGDLRSIDMWHPLFLIAGPILLRAMVKFLARVRAVRKNLEDNDS